MLPMGPWAFRSAHYFHIVELGDGGGYYARLMTVPGSNMLLLPIIDQVFIETHSVAC